MDDGSISSDRETALHKWGNDYKELFNGNDCDLFDDEHLVNAKLYNQHVKESTEDEDTGGSVNDNITRDEVAKSVYRGKLNKAPGFDTIPAEVLRNNAIIDYLTSLFQKCFVTGLVPRAWKRNIISPISKGSSTDPLVPTSHRGLHLLSSVCKVYCDIINQRLVKWMDANDTVADEQCGFRRKRSCFDQIFTLTSIIEDNKRKGQPIYACFIDAKKAFDCVNRDLMWFKLHQVGINGHMLRAIQSLYDGYECSVRVSGSLTAWFGAQKGLKQGCVLSPTLFNIYINTLTTMIKDTSLGVMFGDEIINILLYADDVVLLASNAKDLQMLLDVFNDWSRQWRIVLNPKKSSVVVFRRPCDKQPDYVFKCGNDIITYASEYQHLGLVLNEHLNWDKSVKCLAQAAGRALGTLVAKSKLNGGFDYYIYT
jgi:hypothetical protein